MTKCCAATRRIPRATTDNHYRLAFESVRTAKVGFEGTSLYSAIGAFALFSAARRCEQRSKSRMVLLKVRTFNTYLRNVTQKMQFQRANTKRINY